MDSPHFGGINTILYMNFNYDASCFCIGTTTGFSIFNSSPFQQIEYRGKNIFYLYLISI